MGFFLGNAVLPLLLHLLLNLGADPPDFPQMAPTNSNFSFFMSSFALVKFLRISAAPELGQSPISESPRNLQLPTTAPTGLDAAWPRDPHCIDTTKKNYFDAHFHSHSLSCVTSPPFCESEWVVNSAHSGRLFLRYHHRPFAAVPSALDVPSPPITLVITTARTCQLLLPVTAALRQSSINDGGPAQTVQPPTPLLGAAPSAADPPLQTPVSRVVMTTRTRQLACLDWLSGITCGVPPKGARPPASPTAAAPSTAKPPQQPQQQPVSRVVTTTRTRQLLQPRQTAKSQEELLPVLQTPCAGPPHPFAPPMDPPQQPQQQPVSRVVTTTRTWQLPQPSQTAKSQEELLPVLHNPCLGQPPAPSLNLLSLPGNCTASATWTPQQQPPSHGVTARGTAAAYLGLAVLSICAWWLHLPYPLGNRHGCLISCSILGLPPPIWPTAKGDILGPCMVAEHPPRPE